MSAAISTISHARSTVTTVSIDDLKIDPLVQREEGVDQRRVDKYAANFNPDALGIFIVSERRNGDLILLDGAHRQAAAKKTGYTDWIDARVFRGLSVPEEAALFLLYNDKKDPSPISRFRARVVRGDEDAMAIDQIVRKHGWKVTNFKRSPAVLSAIAATERIYTTASKTKASGAYPELLDQTLAIVTEAWGHDPSGTIAEVIEGVAQLLSRYGKSVDVQKLVRELQATTPRPLIGRAKSLRDLQGGTTAAAVAKIMVSLHNSKKRTNLLPEWVWVR